MAFLPEAAQDLYAVMTDPERGACVSAIESSGLLINPTVKDAKDAIKSAYRRAAEDKATLLLGMLVDACYSGVAGFGAAEEAGAGKSALAAALAWPKHAERIVPAGFVQAIVLFTEATTPQALAHMFGDQLARAVPGFRAAQQAFARGTPYAEQQRLDTLERQVVEPLKRLAPAAEVRLVLDGLDRLATGAQGSVMAALGELASLDFVRLMITARPDTELPNAASVYSLPQAPENASIS